MCSRVGGSDVEGGVRRFRGGEGDGRGAGRFGRVVVLRGGGEGEGDGGRGREELGGNVDMWRVV